MAVSNYLSACFDNGVSIIVPTYYRAEDLRHLFKSIEKQSEKPNQVIIVDDTPNDSIEELCHLYIKKFEKLKIELIYKRNKGKRSSARARNYGIKFADSKFVLFLDSDTYLGVNYIKEIKRTFSEKENALGVQGHVVGPGRRRRTGVKRYFSYFFNKLFLQGHPVRNSCKLFEYPRILETTINCEWLSGCNMALRREILDTYQFDKKLFKYSFSEDVLLSHSIHLAFPNSLYMTPNAKVFHYASDEGRMKKSNDFYDLVDSQRKYVLYSLLGQKGLLIYYRQRIGLFLLRRILSNFF